MCVQSYNYVLGLEAAATSLHLERGRMRRFAGLRQLSLKDDVHSTEPRTIWRPLTFEVTARSIETL